MFLDSNIKKKFFSEEEQALKEDRILPWRADRVCDLRIFSGSRVLTRLFSVSLVWLEQLYVEMMC